MGGLDVVPPQAIHQGVSRGGPYAWTGAARGRAPLPGGASPRPASVAAVSPAESVIDSAAADGDLAATLLLPLAPVVDSAVAWRPDVPAIPDTALPALVAAIRAGLGGVNVGARRRGAPNGNLDTEPGAGAQRPGDDAARLDGACPERLDGACPDAAGAVLWPWGARILDGAGAPPSWSATGLPVEQFAHLATGAAAVLAVAPAIEAQCDPAQPPSRQAEAALLDILARTAPRGAFGWSLVVQVLLDRLARPDILVQLLGSARSGGATPRLRAATEHAVAALLDRLARRGGTVGPLGALDLREAARETERIARLTDAVAGDGAGPERRRRAATLRQLLAAACEQRFRAGLAELTARIDGLAGPPDRRTRARLEADARDLRRLEIEARQLGGAASGEALLRQVSAALAAAPPPAPLGLIDRARLIEILTGPEDALALLGAAVAPAAEPRQPAPRLAAPLPAAPPPS